MKKHTTTPQQDSGLEIGQNPNKKAADQSTRDLVKDIFEDEYLGKPIKLLEQYKGRNIWDWNGSICVNDIEDGKEYLYIVCMDDSKNSGKREFDESANNIETAKKYIDSLTRKPAKEVLQDKHTPLPWRIASQNYKTGFYVIHGIDNSCPDREVQVVKLEYGAHPVKEYLDKAKANAEIIVKAVNSYQSLVDALKASQKLLAAYYPDEETSHLSERKAFQKVMDKNQTALNNH